MIELSHVSKTYETGNKMMKDILLTIEDGELVFIVGKSDSGKSTPMKLLLKGLEPTKGRIVANDMDLGKIPGRYVPKYRRRLDMVFQDFRLLRDRTVFENVAPAQRVIRVPTRAIKETTPEMLRLMGLSPKHKVYPRQLSGGEQQRMAIARVLINNLEVLLVDEPTGNLNSFNTHGVVKPLGEIDQGGVTVIVITHSQEMADEMNKHAIIMERGAVIGDEGRYYSEYQGLLETGPGLLVPEQVSLYRRARIRRGDK